MAEGSVMQVGSSVCTHSAYQSETHLSGGVGLQEVGGAGQRSAYCRELLIRGGEEFTFEELRAERFFKQREREMDERLRHLKEVKEQLSREVEEKRRRLLQRTSQQQPPLQVFPEAPTCQTTDSGTPPAAASSFQIYDEFQSAAARPSGSSELTDDVFLRPDETGLSLRVQCPPPGDVGASQLSQTDVRSQTHSSSAEDHHRGTTEDLQHVVDFRPPSLPQKPVSKTTKNLSPIQETSVEASSVTSLGENQDQDQDQVQEHAPSPGPVVGAVDPCDPDIRRRLLDRCDVTSSPGFHSESRPLPPMCSCLQLGGEVFRIYSRVVDGGSFSIYNGATEDDCVLIKVDSCCVSWDFHQFSHLKKSLSAAADSLPLISCFMFLDGCITVYTSPPDRMFTELTESVPSEDSVGHKAVGLLQLVSQLHSCGLVHAALQPSILTCSHGGFMNPDWVFPVDWSFSVDLDLQRDVTSVQQLPSAQTYISLGLLEPTAPPQLVDLVGVAETVHLLLTNSKMVLVKDDAGWTAERFSRDKTCDMFSRMWRRFFWSLLNAGGLSSLSVLSELKEQLTTLYH
ncbi:mitotic checkpoint serine/threonine-protein kinase BUB1 beta [Trachinotus anak]|uniref:mitotic checkpoint serine/threonine-protein kinase BUB1 beta n=1 Tax=Trachinotus anak TaxID=443729 RepID=UPI0039F17ABE